MTHSSLVSDCMSFPRFLCVFDDSRTQAARTLTAPSPYLLHPLSASTPPVLALHSLSFPLCLALFARPPPKAHTNTPSSELCSAHEPFQPCHLSHRLGSPRRLSAPALSRLFPLPSYRLAPRTRAHICLSGSHAHAFRAAWSGRLLYGLTIEGDIILMQGFFFLFPSNQPLVQSCKLLPPSTSFCFCSAGGKWREPYSSTNCNSFHSCIGVGSCSRACLW
jgi:hypothetical protein